MKPSDFPTSVYKAEVFAPGVKGDEWVVYLHRRESVGGRIIVGKGDNPKEALENAIAEHYSVDDNAYSFEE